MMAIHVKQRDGRTFTVSCEGQNELTIGRVTDNDVVLADQHVSLRHARIVLRDGKYIIVDLKSTNGTYVNGRRIASPQVLKDADKIYVGDFTLSLTANVAGALEPGATPSWMRPIHVERTVIVGESTQAPAPPLPVPRPASDDEVTPAVGMAPSPSRTPSLSPPRPPPPPPRPVAATPRTGASPSGGRAGRTVIDDEAALGLAAVPPGVTPEAGRARPTLDVRVSGVTLIERVRDDGLLVVHRGKASGREARIVVLSERVRDDPECKAMLRDAIKLATLFRSPRLPRLLASDSEPGMLATSPPPGVTTLHDVVRQRGALSPHVALYLALELARSLAEFHEVRDDDGEPLSLTHRGVTLQHVEVARDGAVHLDGYLLSRTAASWRAVRTGPGILKGELPFMSPEQVRGLPADARSDLWSLGVCLYTLANGANPFVGETPFDTLELVRNAAAPPLEAAPTLQPVIDALLVHDADERTQTARDAIALMEQAALSLPPASRLDVERLVR